VGKVTIHRGTCKGLSCLSLIALPLKQLDSLSPLPWQQRKVPGLKANAALIAQLWALLLLLLLLLLCLSLWHRTLLWYQTHSQYRTCLLAQQSCKHLPVVIFCTAARMDVVHDCACNPSFEQKDDLQSIDHNRHMRCDEENL